MKQLLQSLRNGSTHVADVPAPCCADGQVLCRTALTLVSSGTERMMVEFGKGSLLQKARSQPDKVRQVLEKARTDGVAATVDAVQSKLDQPVALGYCNVGRVIESRSDGFSIGDRVVSNGPHAEIVAVHKHLCAPIPDEVSDEAASFTVLAAIGLQGIRLAQPTLGESIAVFGLGAIGLLTVQMLRAHGCRVLGVDLDDERLSLAHQFGAETVNPYKDEDVLAHADRFSRGAGIDAVIICASSKSDEPISQAARMCRKRGRIVLVGVVGLSLRRDEFYEKELTFQVSCSYGPGRYDTGYEEKGHDYPMGYVRWTEQRNFEAVLDLMARGAIDISSLVTHRFTVDNGADAMECLTSPESSLGILLEFPQVENAESPSRTVSLTNAKPEGLCRFGFLGAGNYAGRVLMPAFRSAGAQLHSVASGGGVSAVHFGKKFGFVNALSDASEVIRDPDVDIVVIATRHNFHASQILEGLRAGKHVFCEKPLCLTTAELLEIQAELAENCDRQLMVGFNRRFAPHIVKMKSLLSNTVEPKKIVITVNAGYVPADHWTQDVSVGGGRLIGEACHFIDLARYLVDQPIVDYQAIPLGAKQAKSAPDENFTAALEFADGAVCVLHYLANGHRGYPKERVEVFCEGKVVQLDNFLKFRAWGFKGQSRMSLWRQDKGVNAMAEEFVSSLRHGGPALIPADQIFEVSRVAIELAESLRV